MHTATRNLKLGRLTILQVTSQVVGIAIMIGWAAVSPTVWALVAGGVSIALTRAVLSHLILDGTRNGFAWDRDAAYELLHFGKWIFLNSGLYFWATQGDRILLGKLTTFAQVGIYQIGFNLSQPIVMLNFQLSRSVFMPVFSETFRDTPERLRDVYYRVRLYSDLLLIPLLGLAMGISDIVVQFLYDHRYWDAGPILEIFLLQAALRCILEPAESCVLAIGLPGRLTAAHLSRTVLILGGIPIGFHYLGLEGVAWAVVCAEIPVLFFVWRCLSGRRVLSIAREMRAVLGLAVGYGAGQFLAQVISAFLAGSA